MPRKLSKGQLPCCGGWHGRHKLTCQVYNKNFNDTVDKLQALPKKESAEPQVNLRPDVQEDTGQIPNDPRAQTNTPPVIIDQNDQQERHTVPPELPYPKLHLQGSAKGGASSQLPKPLKGSTTMKTDIKKLQERIASRRKERSAQTKFAMLKVIANGPDAQHVGVALTQLSQAFGQLASHTAALRDNLGLTAADPSANLKDKIAVARKFAGEFKRIAEQEPEQLRGALSEIYQSVDEIAEGLEALAGNMGFELEVIEETAPAHPHEGPEPEGVVEQPVAPPAEEPVVEEEEVEVEATADGSAGFVTDRDESGRPKLPARL